MPPSIWPVVAEGVGEPVTVAELLFEVESLVFRELPSA